MQKWKSGNTTATNWSKLAFVKSNRCICCFLFTRASPHFSLLGDSGDFLLSGPTFSCWRWWQIFFWLTCFDWLSFSFSSMQCPQLSDFVRFPLAFLQKLLSLTVECFCLFGHIFLAFGFLCEASALCVWQVVLPFYNATNFNGMRIIWDDNIYLEEFPEQNTPHFPAFLEVVIIWNEWREWSLKIINSIQC